MTRAKERFEEWTGQFDVYSDAYQDMGADEYFVAGYQAALRDIAQELDAKYREMLDTTNSRHQVRQGAALGFSMASDYVLKLARQ